MLAFFENMFDGRLCGCYILTISIEKQRKCPPFFFLKYFWRTDGRATGGADPNATRNWRFVKTDGVYFSCFSMIVHGFAEATTDTIWVFYLFNETSILCAQTVHFGTSDDKQPSRRQGGAWKSTGKNAYEMKIAVNAKKHIRKRYTHAIAKVSILSRQNRQQQWPPHQHPPLTNKGRMEDCVTRACALVRA